MEPNKKAVLPWIIVAVALVLAVAVWYYYPLLGGSAVPAGEDAVTLQLQTQSQSDEISVIDQDLNATDLGDLDKELSEIDAELAR